MQSQQKKIKWSRGETADALEERTDTGITQVSVSKLENITSDIYGNISRRPAFRIIKSDDSATDLPIISGNSTLANTAFSIQPQSFVFTVDANTYILFIRDALIGAFGGFLIQNGKFIKKVKLNNQTGLSLTFNTKHISAAQYNNFMVVANLYDVDVIFRLSATNDINIETFTFSAPWYAPYGTQTKQISQSDVTGLDFDASSVGQYTYTEFNGETTVYSWIKTGISNTGITGVYNGPTITYYYHRFSDGAAMFDTNPTSSGVTDYTAATLVNGQTYTGGTQTAIWGYNGKITLEFGNNRAFLFDGQHTTLELTGDFTISQPAIMDYIPIGSIVQFPNNGAHMRVEGFDSDGSNLRMYGAFLTPLANDTAHDTVVKVETGYISLTTYTPTKFTFSDQRLYASGFYNQDQNIKLIPGYVVGSQIARYTDFKNDYNTQNEPISIDISTSYQEQVVSMIDYNGLKILTDSAEYAFTNGAIVKQSENGSLADCNPLVVGSVCVYADKSGHQLRAMQYEFQSNLFTSSSINQMAKEDLIFNTTSMASHLDKEHFTGRFLYTIQHKYVGDLSLTPYADHTMAVCNFVPGNQAMIWARWTSPIIRPNSGISFADRHSIGCAIEVNNKVWFIMGCAEVVANQYVYPAYTLAELDYDDRLDVETELANTETEYRIIPSVYNDNYFAWVDQNDPDNIVYTKTSTPTQGDSIYDANEQEISTADNSPGGPNITIGGVGYYQWGTGGSKVYTKSEEPDPTGLPDDESRELYDENGTLLSNQMVYSYNPVSNAINMGQKPTGGMPVPIYTLTREFSSSTLDYTINSVQYSAEYDSSKNKYVQYATMPGATISVFDGDTYMWSDTLDAKGKFNTSLGTLTNPHVGFMVNATLESHPIDIGGKTYTEKKRIGKAVAVINNTEPGAFTVCNKTGYTSVDKKTVNFYGCTGMKDLVRYTINNIQGAKFTIESLTMIIEYGTLDS